MSAPAALLEPVLAAARCHFADDLAACQVWVPCDPSTSASSSGANGGDASSGLGGGSSSSSPRAAQQRQQQAGTAMFHVACSLPLAHSDPLQPFAAASAAAADGAAFSLPARAHASGCVQVLQELSVLPPFVHPRSRLPPAAAPALGGALYVPVFEAATAAAGPSAAAAPIAVIEALLVRRAADPMALPNLASFFGSALAAAGLSLCSPTPQRVGRSALAGRRPRPPVDASDSDESDSEGAKRGTRPRPVFRPPTPPAAAAAPPRRSLEAAGKAVHGGAEAAAPTDSADSSCTAADMASCGTFAVGAAARGRSADASDGGCWAAAPAGKRRCFAAAGGGGMRRTQSVSRSLRDLAAAS